MEYLPSQTNSEIYPLQVKIIPITDNQLDYANKIKDALFKEDIRVEIDDKSETMQNKSESSF